MKLSLWFRQAGPGCVEVGASTEERAAMLATKACRLALNKGASRVTVESTPFVLQQAEQVRLSAASVPGFCVRYV